MRTFSGFCVGRDGEPDGILYVPLTTSACGGRWKGRMTRFRSLLPLLALLACDSTKTRVDPDNPEGDVTINADELEPVAGFVLETRRVIAAEFVKIEMSQQFFEQQMSYTRDPRYVVRSPVQVLEDGTKVLRLDNANTEQATNIDPDLLPRVSFGTNGLEIRAYRTIVVYVRPARDRMQPLFLRVRCKGASSDVRMWVSGRLHDEKFSLNLDSALLWDETKEEYVHRSSIG
jgi:hypothetical protein